MLEIARRFGVESVDYIISGIPFTFLQPEVKRCIIRDTRKMLTESGKFIVYQAYPKPIKKAKKIVPYLSEYFQIENKYPQLLNLPPLEILEAGIPADA